MRAAMLVVAALFVSAAASAYESGRPAISKPQLADPRLDDPEEFRRFVDLSRRLANNTSLPVMGGERVMAPGAGAPILDRPFVPRSSRVEAPAAPAARLELPRADPRAPYVGIVISAAQHAGLALLLLGLTGPLRRASVRRSRDPNDYP